MRFLLILFIVILFMRYVLPIVLRWAVTAFVRKQMQNNGFVVPPQSPPGPPPATGQVRVDYVPPQTTVKQPPQGLKGGEYVEFEEV